MASVQELEKQLFDLTVELHNARCAAVPQSVPDYRFQTDSGDVLLSELFGDNERLLVIHNMGQGCRYCTLWGDGFNGLVPHLESAMSVAMVSGDSPDQQRRFANSRQWRFRMASHAGGDYLREQVATDDYANAPGAACYQKRDSGIVRLNSTLFGPGDQFSPQWHLLGLAGIDMQSWTPQYRYWQRPGELDDGGENILD